MLIRVGQYPYFDTVKTFQHFPGVYNVIVTKLKKLRCRAWGEPHIIIHLYGQLAAILFRNGNIANIPFKPEY